MKKFLIIAGSIFVLLLGAIILIPIIYHDKIITLIKEESNKQLNATLRFDNDIELSILQHFPNLTLGINQLSIVGINEFEGDTLIHLDNFEATLDIMSVIKGNQIKIINIQLTNPLVNALVNKSGKVNWDITKPSIDTSSIDSNNVSSPLTLSLKKLTIINGHILYDDKPGNMNVELKHFNQTLSGDFSEETFMMDLMMSSDEFTYTLSSIPYLNKVKMSMSAQIEANMKTMHFTFKENELALNELKLGFDGWVAMPQDDIEMDLKYGLKQADFKHLLSLVPAIYAKDFSSMKASGKLLANGFAKGIYGEKSIPAFEFNLMVENGEFQYPDLPSKMNAINLNLQLANNNGDINSTTANLSQFHFELMGDPFDARLLAKNIMIDPLIDADIKGRINFNHLSKVIPLEEGMKIEGILNMDITAKGSLSTIENEQYESMDARGNFGLANFVFVSKELPKPYLIKTAQLAFNPKSVNLTKFDAQIGKSDMQMTGELKNFFAYSLGHGTLNGKLNFKSNTLDVNEFMSPSSNESTSTTADTAALQAPVLPDNINFTLNASINKLNYTNLIISDFEGQVILSESKLSFNKVALTTIGSQISMNGFYETTNPKKPYLAMNFGIKNMEFQKAFKTFNTIQKLAPIAENMTGTFSTQFNMNTELDSHLNPVFDSLYAKGNVDIPKAGFKDVQLFNKMADIIQYSKLKDPTLENVLIQFEVKNGRIFTEPFDMIVTGQKLTMSGSTGLDQTIDYKGKTTIPRSSLGVANATTNSMLAKANEKAGTNIKLSENIPIDIGLGGTFTSPKITTNLAQILKDEANSVKNQLMDEAGKKVKELEAKAKAEADRLKKETEAKARAEADKLKKQAELEVNNAKAKAQTEVNKAKLEAEKAKKEAELKAKEESDKLKKQAEEEAKRKLKGIFGK